jgi:MYXO-CTERM domain-containing protein
VLAATPAWALEPGKHRSIAEKACADVHLPDAFCHRMGQEVYQTDYREWTTLSAHAQRELGEDRCTAADAAMKRVDKLARDVIAYTRGGDFDSGAAALGRAIHTLQDECAHHGMTNQEHAYLSLTQACTDQTTSPDVQPAAIQCAQARTREAFAALATALADTRWDYVERICQDYDNRDTCQTAALPTPFMACDFLAEHDDWDGEDSRWNGDLVGPALVAAFEGGLRGDASPAPICGSDEKAIDPVAPHPLVTNREAGCNLIDITCLGKVDDPGTSSADTGGGCSTGGGGGGMPGLIVLAALFGRRRRAMLGR